MFMAKKKRRITEEKAEEYVFTPKDFDEREFILKDMYGTKVLVIVTILAFIVGIIGAVLCNINSDYWMIATAISFIMVIVMKKFLVLIGIRADMIETKTMLGNYLMFLMLALGICIVGINAPFV